MIHKTIVLVDQIVVLCGLPVGLGDYQDSFALTTTFATSLLQIDLKDPQITHAQVKLLPIHCQKECFRELGKRNSREG